MTTIIKPFRISIPESDLTYLRRRLELTRWPEKETVGDWSQGVPLAQAKSLVEHWRTKYDWRRCEARLNALGQFTTEIDGVSIHFLHVRSKHENAMPMIPTRGWPGSVIEFLKVIGPLTDPTAHGGRVEDAFHLVIPSLLGGALHVRSHLLERGSEGRPLRRFRAASVVRRGAAQLLSANSRLIGG